MTDSHAAYYVRFGRAPDCDWVIQLPTVSATHCQVYWAPDAGSFVLEDLQSTHGTWLNGKRLPKNRSAPVQIGDEIGLGARISFRLGPHHVQKLTRPGQAWRPLPLPEIEPTTARQSNVRLAGAEAWGVATPHTTQPSEGIDIWSTASEGQGPRGTAPWSTQSLERRAPADTPLVLVSPPFVGGTSLVTLGLIAPFWTALTFHSVERLQHRTPSFGAGFVAGLLGPFWLLSVWLTLPSKIAATYPVQAAQLNFRPLPLACLACIPIVGPAVWLHAVTTLLQQVWADQRSTTPHAGPSHGQG